MYIGVTSNLELRVKQHKNGIGSLFTKKYNVYELMYFETFTNIDDAIKREKQLKKWNKDWKWGLIKIMNPNLVDLLADLKL